MLGLKIGMAVQGYFVLMKYARGLDKIFVFKYCGDGGH
jgi:hypothetical protein